MAKPRTTLTFLGAAGTVTGSKFLLTVGGRRILVDSGLFQGEKQWRLKNWEEFPTDPATISDLVLTHAHLDHCGYLPALVRNGFRGPIWCTEGTRRLAEIVLRDAAKLQEQEAEDANERGYSKHEPALPLYTTEDVEATLPLFTTLEYDADFELTGNDDAQGNPGPDDERVVVRLTRAGHILGSASATVWTPTASVVFSGDLGRAEHPVLKPRETPPSAPYVLIESTYGDREHPEPPDLPHEGFADVIRRTIERGGTVLVPAFAVDRTEIVLKLLTELEKQGRIPDVPIYVNSPMANAALDVYRTMTDELRPDLAPGDFVDLPDLHTIRTPEDSKKLTAEGGHGPSIIIASSGMATGGRVLHHLERLLPDPRNAVVLTGYQGVGTRGRQLVDGATQVKMRGRYIPVKAEIFQDREFSVHADGSDLLDWLAALTPRPTTVFCVHGEPDAAAALAARIHRELGISTVVPQFGEVALLDERGSVPDADGVHHPAAPAVARAASTRVVAPREGEVPTLTGPVEAPRLPSGRLRYRCLTGPDDAEFCRRVSAALDEGYVLHGGPALTFDGQDVVVAQAVVWPTEWPTTPGDAAGAAAARQGRPAYPRPPVPEQVALPAESESFDPDHPTRVDVEPTGQED